MLSELRKDWSVSAYNEDTAEEIEYFMDEDSCSEGSTAYIYFHETGVLMKAEILHIICNLDDMQAYDTLLENEDVLVDEESKYQADTSCEFITDHACYLVWFRYVNNEQTVILSKKEADFINQLLTMTGDEIYKKYGLKRDETISHTVKFQDGIEADIKLVICEDDVPYTEGILFQNGAEITCTECNDHYIGTWTFEALGNNYVVNIESADKTNQEKGEKPWHLI